MAEVITGKDLQSAGTAITGATNSEGGGMANELKGIKELADTVDSILSKLTQMKGKYTGGQQQSQKPAQQNFPQQTPYAPSTANTTQQQPKQEERIVYKDKPINIDKDKVKTMIHELIVNEAPKKLPNDIQEKQISDMIGENFQNFKYNYKNIVTVGSDKILDVFAEQLVKMMENLQKEEEK